MRKTQKPRPKKSSAKQDFPTENARQILEPGPIVLVSSQWHDHTNIMTMGWHTMMEFTPSLFGCIIANSNASFDMIRRSGECVINVPTADMADQVIGIGTSSDEKANKFKKFGLTPVRGKKVDAPLIQECFANFECRLHDGRLIPKYNFFIFEIVAAHVAPTPKKPKTLHYHGEGIFTVSGKKLNLRRRFHGKSL